MNRELEVVEARVRAKFLLKTMSARDAARRMAAEFHICIYSVHGAIFGSYFETDRVERVSQLA